MIRAEKGNDVTYPGVSHEKQNYEHVSGGKRHQFCLSMVNRMICITAQERVCPSIGHGKRPSAVHVFGSSCKILSSEIEIQVKSALAIYQDDPYGKEKTLLEGAERDM